MLNKYGLHLISVKTTLVSQIKMLCWSAVYTVVIVLNTYLVVETDGIVVNGFEGTLQKSSVTEPCFSMCWSSPDLGPGTFCFNTVLTLSVLKTEFCFFVDVNIFCSC